MSEFECVILGAGPAGSAAAITAARAGLSVALIDKASFPRNKLCGGLFTGRAKRYFEEIFATEITAPLIETRDQVVFHHNGAPMGELADIPPLHLTMRWDFDDFAVGQALEAGVAPYLGERVAALDLEGKTVTLQSGTVLRFEVLIGADGVNSAVARALFGRAYEPETIGFALEQELPPEEAPGPVQIEFGAARYGYGWRFPKRHSTTVGVGGLHGLNGDMTARYAAYAGDSATRQGVPLKGHFLPFGAFRKRPGQGAVLLAGDAAGLVDPITGEGIAYALKSGQLAADAAVRAIRGGVPDHAMRHYQSALRPIHRSLRIANWLRPIIFSDRSGPAFARSFRSGGGTLKHAYMRMLAGEVEYPELMALALRRAPKLLWRRLRG